MIVKYKILEENELLIIKFIGDFSIEDYSKYVLKLIKQPHFDDINSVLTDLRNTKSDMAFKNLHVLIKFRKNNIKNNYLNVMIVNDPLTTAAAHLYKEYLKELYNYEYCSTVEYAIELLGLTDIREKIITELDKLS